MVRRSQLESYFFRFEFKSIRYFSVRPPFQTAFVSMRDGIKLGVDFMDTKTERFPVILELTSYGREPLRINYRYEAPYWFEYGYLFVIADYRSTIIFNSSSAQKFCRIVIALLSNTNY